MDCIGIVGKRMEIEIVNENFRWRAVFEIGFEGSSDEGRCGAGHTDIEGMQLSERIDQWSIELAFGAGRSDDEDIAGMWFEKGQAEFCKFSVCIAAQSGVFQFADGVEEE